MTEEDPRDKFFPKEPADIAELTARAGAITIEMWLAPYLSGSESRPEIEVATHVLNVWDVLERCGIRPPEWVDVARAASWYWET